MQDVLEWEAIINATEVSGEIHNTYFPVSQKFCYYYYYYWHLFYLF